MDPQPKLEKRFAVGASPRNCKKCTTSVRAKPRVTRLGRQGPVQRLVWQPPQRALPEARRECGPVSTSRLLRTFNWARVTPSCICVRSAKSQDRGRATFAIHKSSPGKVPQKARPRVRVRLAQEVQEVEPESYDVRERSPLRSAPSSSSGIVRPSAVPPTSAPNFGGCCRRRTVHFRCTCWGPGPYRPACVGTFWGCCRRRTGRRARISPQAGSCRQNPSPSDRPPRLR